MSVRFAPSPTGRFHVGNLRTAWISYQWAKFLGTRWIVRFEDIDSARVIPDSREWQLADMRELGLAPYEIVIQSTRHDRHHELFLKAVKTGQVYACSCSRREITEALRSIASAPNEIEPSVQYSGNCRNLERNSNQERKASGHTAWRFRSPDPSGCDDFLVARTDGDRFVPAYHWACAVDDVDGGYGLLVRASDLRSAVSRQRAVMAWVLESDEPAKMPAVFHCALVTQNDGHRLEKRTQGVTLSELKKSGLSPRALTELFEKSLSFDFHAFNPGEIFGEADETLTLQRLGAEIPLT